eukprot:CAMPEP_0169132964 /NCGR_PEP_ID=MMETSP1015-20121227/39058_1 /TAXON_ID=342587 /ORGANISM="Karlodinium micrum, Strain CCMP2283" /LENGTH=547 /DNA_ID=CAMNT_0009197321 /DNA_START=50 /DNA_END=1693 /DNA_ORIENTATION=-
MAHMCLLRLALVIFLSATQANAQPRNFLRQVSLREIEVDLQGTLADLFRGSANNRLSNIERKTWQSFQALPKNELGRLAPLAVRYIVHAYFTQEHGWLITGLEPHGMQLNASEMHDVSILQDKAPLLVETILEARQADHGLAFNDIVAMIAVLEQLMFDESVTLLHAAYTLNGASIQDQITEGMLHQILQSYLILFGQGSKANLHDAKQHKLVVESRRRPELEEFESDVVLNYEFANRHRTNPFIPRRYSFQIASEILEILAQQYGKWQNTECRDMKAHLVELDPEGLGRVPLGLFYAQPQGSIYHFSESADYLRNIGALDETSTDAPMVIIANYVSGPSNCIASSSYYSVCCLSECDAIFGELEKRIAAPAALAQRVLALVSNMSEKTLPSGLSEKLDSIAAQHGGQVPLYGRLFAQWLHFAFPRECPYPSLVGSSTALTPSAWLDERKTASIEERRQHIEASVASAAFPVEELDINGRWSDLEVLPVLGPTRSPMLLVGMGGLRVLVQAAAILVVLRSAWGAWRAVFHAHGATKKDDDSMFSFGV